MATESYTIYSRYDPLERKTLEHNTGQLEELNPDFAWESNEYLIPQHRRPPPHFIPATTPLDRWGNEPLDKHLPENTCSENSSMGNHLSVWYRSLTSKREAKPFVAKLPEGSEEMDTSRITSFKAGEKKNKNNWFIMKALHSQEALPSSPNPSLADIIARDPPPMPTEERYKPPVWLEISPSNKGYEMLQKSGWSEGEPLGPDVVRRPQHLQGQMIKLGGPESNNRRKAREDPIKVKNEVVESKWGGYEDVCELREVEIIDLTLSDSNPEDEDDPSPTPGTSKTEEHIAAERTLHPKPPPAHSSAKNSRTALLTPIATVLKSDRLGIGLKAKAVGPFKASQKRITHNAAALAAHVRAAEESQKRKRLLGRGKRGLATWRRGEELERKRLLAYLNN